MSPVSACIWKPWSVCSAAPTRLSSTAIRPVAPAWYPICRLTSYPTHRVTRREGSDETQRLWRRDRRTDRGRVDRGLFVALHHIPDPAGTSAASRSAAAADHRTRATREGAIHRPGGL